MTLTFHERALLPLVGLQGAIGSLAGFIGFFIVDRHDLHALFRYTAGMLTVAMASTFIAYLAGPRLHLSGRRLFRLGFLVPGVLLVAGRGSVGTMAVAYGAFTGLTWGARHSLEMSLLRDEERDSYASHSVTAAVALGVAATFVSTLVLAGFAEQSRTLYRLYGVACIAGALLLGKAIPETEPVSLKNPLAVIRQPQFIACLPLFFLESGLFGVTQAMASAGAANALSSASRFGWVATVAGLVGGVALYFTRQSRDVQNRVPWLGASCLVVALSFVLLGASAWVPVLYIAYSVLKAAGQPFLSASEQVLNQRTLDIEGALSDRIFAREFVLWALRMASLGLFWGLAMLLAPLQLLVVGSTLLAAAAGMEYVIGKTLFWNGNGVAEQAA